MDYEVKDIKIDDEFKICPSCGYEDGFHSMFKKEGDSTKWLFICPSCHIVFDIGFTVQSSLKEGDYKYQSRKAKAGSDGHPTAGRIS